MLQDPFLFSGTIAENIRYGRLDATDEDVRRAATVAGATPFIEALPEGFDTPVGERGGTLSTGQRQLIAFARAIVGDPAILILDEATSSVDTRTELLIQKGLRSILRAAPRSSSPTASRRCATPTGSSCSRTDGSSSTAPTASCSPPAARSRASTRRSSASRLLQAAAASSRRRPPEGALPKRKPV